jgi:hypothetical protein
MNANTNHSYLGEPDDDYHHPCPATSHRCPSSRHGAAVQAIKPVKRVSSASLMDGGREMKSNTAAASTACASPSSTS